MRLIDADALKKLMEEECAEECAICCYANSGDGCRCKLIDNVPTVEYPFYQEAYQTGYEEGKNERPHGKWMPNKVAFYWVCSECGAEVRSNIAEVYLTEHTLNFCPNCGADMKGANK